MVGIKNDERIFVILEALIRGVSVDKIHDITMITVDFIEKLKHIVDIEKAIAEGGKKALDEKTLKNAKIYGMSDKYIAGLVGTTESEVRELRKSFGITPKYGIIDVCGKDKGDGTPYYYSRYEGESDYTVKSGDKTVVVLGSGPIRIGQGVEIGRAHV